MQIGEPIRTIVVEPLELPVQEPKAEPEPARSRARARGGTSLSVIVPDYISRRHRTTASGNWDAAGLKSLNGELWLPSQPLSAVCRADANGSISGLSKATHNPDELPYFNCTCGVYAAKNVEHLHQCGYGKFGVHGEVYLWGRVVEHERGWRAAVCLSQSPVSCARHNPVLAFRDQTLGSKL